MYTPFYDTTMPKLHCNLGVVVFALTDIPTNIICQSLHFFCLFRNDMFLAYFSDLTMVSLFCLNTVKSKFCLVYKKLHFVF